MSATAISGYSALFCILIQIFLVAAGDQPHDWDYLMFARVWPESICRVSDKTNKTNCVIPTGVDRWTVHGLWPSKAGSHHGPNFCNNTDRFDVKAISQIENVMLKQWPNLFPSTTTTSFWSHEWLKHGTCGLNFPPLAGEFNYFSKALSMDDKFDLNTFLEKAGIVESETTTYTTEQIHDAVQRVFNAEPLLHCLPIPKKDGGFYLADIRICLSKEFGTIDCTTNSLDFDSTDPANVRNPVIPTVVPCPAHASIIYPVHSGGISNSKKNLAPKSVNDEF